MRGEPGSGGEGENRVHLPAPAVASGGPSAAKQGEAGDAALRRDPLDRFPAPCRGSLAKGPGSREEDRVPRRGEHVAGPKKIRCAAGSREKDPRSGARPPPALSSRSHTDISSFWSAPPARAGALAAVSDPRAT